MTIIHVPEQTINLDSGNTSINFEIQKNPVPLPKVNYPLGKGILIWNLDNDYLSTVDKLVGLGIKWVAPKVVNATSSYNSIYIKQFIIECRKSGIDVWGWGYTFGVNAGVEGSETSKVINDLDITGYFIDAEGQYDQVNTLAMAQAYCGNLKPNTNKPIGLCSYRYPSLHQNVPWKTFLDICDFHCQQLYWIQATLPNAPTLQLAKSYAELQTIKKLPMIPIGTCVKDDNSVWIPTADQILNFQDGVQKLTLPGYGFYNLDSMVSNLSDTIKQLA